MHNLGTGYIEAEYGTYEYEKEKVDAVDDNDGDGDIRVGNKVGEYGTSSLSVVIPHLLVESSSLD